MDWCFQRMEHLVWTGYNFTEVQEFLAPNINPESNYSVSVQGTDLHINRYGQSLVLSPGMHMVTTWPNVFTDEEFAANYGIVPE